MLVLLNNKVTTQGGLILYCGTDYISNIQSIIKPSMLENYLNRGQNNIVIK